MTILAFDWIQMGTEYLPASTHWGGAGAARRVAQQIDRQLMRDAALLHQRS